MKDPYATLGVARDADDGSIRKAYRRLAREFHPDVNPENAAAEERFKAVAEAYSILSDAERRSAYDEFGEVALEAGFDAAAARRARNPFGGPSPFGGHGFGSDGLDDLIGNLFGRGGAGRRGRGRSRSRGLDLEAELELEFLEAAKGGEKRLRISRPTAGGGNRPETVLVRIPPGVADGGQIRLRGKGGEGIEGGAAGDLIATIRIREHPFFRREKRDVILEVPVSVTEATLGASIEVPTIDGRVTVTLPPGTDSGSKLRLRGKGIAHPSGRGAGDFFVVVKVCVPRNLDASAISKVEELAHFDPPNLREALE